MILLLTSISCALASLALLVCTLWFAVKRRSRQSPRLRLIRRIQAQWSSPLLLDEAIAGRIIDVVASPVSRKKYRLQLAISGVQPTTEEDWLRPRISIGVQAEFALVNLGDKPLAVSPRQSAALERKLEVWVDGQPYEVSDRDDQRQLQISPKSERTIRIEWSQDGRLPYVGVFPQTTPVARDAQVTVSFQNLQANAGVFVTGPGRVAWYEPDWGGKGSIEEKHFPIPNPIFPGDTIVLTVGV